MIGMDDLLPLVDKDVKTGTGQGAVFKLFSGGVATQRDEWVYDYSKDTLADKMQFFVDIYQQTLTNPAHPDRFQIKWDRELTKYLERGINTTLRKSGLLPASTGLLLKYTSTLTLILAVRSRKRGSGGRGKVSLPLLRSLAGYPATSHQRGDLPLRLHRAARPGLSPQVRTQPQARISAHPLL